jgi:hypothetical protein
VSLRGRGVASTEVLPVRRLTTREAVREKFRHCAACVLAARAIEVVETQILAIDEQRDLEALMSAASGPCRENPKGAS